MECILILNVCKWQKRTIVFGKLSWSVCLHSVPWNFFFLFKKQSFITQSKTSDNDEAAEVGLIQTAQATKRWSLSALRALIPCNHLNRASGDLKSLLCFVPLDLWTPSGPEWLQCMAPPAGDSGSLQRGTSRLWWSTRSTHTGPWSCCLHKCLF